MIYMKNNISIGKELSFDLNLKLGDKVMIMSPSGIQNYSWRFTKTTIFYNSILYMIVD